MRFDRRPILVTVQDKFAVREYAKARGVRCAPLLHVTEDPATIPFDALPPDCMIKATHGWNWTIARTASDFYLFGDGSMLPPRIMPTADAAWAARQLLGTDEVIAMCRQWLASRHKSNEWAYQHMPPRILIEETLLPREGHELLDYRLYTFQGQVRAVNLGSARFRRERANVFLRPDWSLIPLTRYCESLPEAIPPRPDTLPHMIDIARRLGERIDFVRIDLYDTTRGVLLGEMTVYPNAGTRGKPSGCPVLDAWLGAQWPMSPGRHGAAAAWNVIDWAVESWRELRSRARARRNCT